MQIFFNVHKQFQDGYQLRFVNCDWNVFDFQFKVI